MRSAALVLGYHGCDREVGERILRGGEHLQPSENDYDWLGSGIYFWEDNPTRALEWAQFVRDNPKFSRARIREPFVIGAVIEPGNCLDLLESDSIRMVDEAYQRLAAALQLAGAPMPKNRRFGNDWAVRRLDCAVINQVHEFSAAEGMATFDSVRAAFVEGEPLYPSAGFHRRTHIQLCLRSSEQVIGYFRPHGF